MEEQTLSGGKMKLVITALVSTCFTLMTLMPVAFMVWQQMPPHIATINLQQVVEEEQARWVNSTVSSDGRVSEVTRSAEEKRSIDFAQRLSQQVEQLGDECHCILINRAALLSGNTVDYTDVLKERLKK